LYYRGPGLGSWHEDGCLETVRGIPQFIRVRLRTRTSICFEVHYRQRCFTPFCFNAPCKCITPLNLRPVIFGLEPVGWLYTLAREYVSHGAEQNSKRFVLIR